MKSFLSVVLALTITSTTSRAEEKIVTNFYTSTGKFFDLKPHTSEYLPFYVPLMEGILFPGGGHVSNGHISKAAMTVIVAGLGLGIGIPKLINSHDKEERSNSAMNSGSVYDINSKRDFDASRIYFANKYEYWHGITMAGLNIMDAIFESTVLWGRDEPDDTAWFVGASSRTSNYASSATVDESALSILSGQNVGSGGVHTNKASKNADTAMPGGLVGVEGGRTSQKRLMIDLGIQSARIQYEWWFGVPLSKMNLGDSVFTRNFAPSLGYRYLTYDLLSNNSTPTTSNNSFNRFGMSTGDFWFGAVWKKGMRNKFVPESRFVESLTGGLGIILVNLGTTWLHPTDYVGPSSDVGGQGVTSQRASAPGALNNLGFRMWASARVWDLIAANLEFEWFKATEDKDPSGGPRSTLKFWEIQLTATARF